MRPARLMCFLRARSATGREWSHVMTTHAVPMERHLEIIIVTPAT